VLVGTGRAAGQTMAGGPDGSVEMDAAPPRLAMLIACDLPDEVSAMFERAFDVTSRRYPSAQALAEDAARLRPDVILAAVGVPVDAAAIRMLPDSVGAIATYSVGHDHIDLDAARARGIAVFNTPDVLTEAVAEVALFLLLGAARRATESIALLRSGQWAGWTPTQLNGVELWGKTLGIFGMGRIGRAIAARARGFGMSIRYCSRNRLPPEAEEGAAYHSDPQEMFALLDALVLACPATPETRGFLDARRIGWLKPGALVVNIARGNVVVDDDLIAALLEGRIRAAGLDVFNGEPGIDPRYHDLPNVFMLPHIGSSTVETRRRMGRILIEGISAWRAGVAPGNRLV